MQLECYQFNQAMYINIHPRERKTENQKSRFVLFFNWNVLFHFPNDVMQRLGEEDLIVHKWKFIDQIHKSLN